MFDVGYILLITILYCQKKHMEFELKRPAAGKKNKTLIYQHLPSGVKKTLKDG